MNAVGTGAQSAASNSVTPIAPVSAPTVVQSSPVAEGAGGTVSVTGVLPSTPTAGNRLVAVYYSWGAESTAPAPAGWTKDASLTGSVESSRTLCIYSKVVSGDGTNHTFTPSSPIHQGVKIYEITASTVDTTYEGISVTSVTSLPLGPTGTPTASVLALAGSVMVSVVTETFSFPAGWTGADGARFSAGVRDAATSSAVSVTLTKTGTARNGAGAIATYKGA